MKYLKRSNILILAIFLLNQILLHADAPNNDMTQEEYYNIDINEIEKLKAEALQGKTEAAWKLWEYFEFSKYEYTEADFWELIICENELNANAEGTYNYAVSLINQSNNSDRGWFWLYRCKKAGYVYNEYLQDLYRKADSKVEQYISIDKEIEFSKINMSVIEYMANFGNGDAAYYIYKQYALDTSKKAEALNWLRIGAQNGNLKCIKEYCECLKKSSNKYEKIRAEFWHKQLK